MPRVESWSVIVSVVVAWKRYASTSRLPVRPRPVPRTSVPGKPGVAMSVKRFGVEEQPSFVCVP